MKLFVDVLAGVAACGVAYYLASSQFNENEVTPDVHRNPHVRNPHVPDGNDAGPPVSAVPPEENRAASARPSVNADEVSDAGPSAEQEFSMNMLRNAVITATAKDMYQRGEDILKCLDGVQLAGAEKIWFSVDIVSKPDEATIGRWRFVEVADGEPLPDSFASCAARAFGGGQHLVPPKDIHFPQYRGDLSILYTIPAPSAD
jgi:hypothetical protein